VFAGDDDEVFITSSFNVTPKTTEQNLIVRSGKSEAVILIVNDCARGVVLLKLTRQTESIARTVCDSRAT